MIDWFTVFAQIFNFLILVFLLKRFLYGPIISAMEKREEKIAGRLREAQQKGIEADQEMEKYREKNEELETQRAEMLNKAREEAEEQKKELLQNARMEVEEIRSRWEESVEQEKESFLRNLQKHTAEQIYSVAVKAFSDLAELNLEQHMIKVFLHKIENIDTAELEKLKVALKESENGVTVATSFEVPDKEQGSVIQAIRNLAGTGYKVRFVKSEDIICGIELRLKGYLMGWSLKEYIQSLRDDIDKALSSKGKGI